jgi:hypothetical protein
MLGGVGSGKTWNVLLELPLLSWAVMTLLFSPSPPDKEALSKSLLLFSLNPEKLKAIDGHMIRAAAIKKKIIVCFLPMHNWLSISGYYTL